MTASSIELGRVVVYGSPDLAERACALANRLAGRAVDGSWAFGGKAKEVNAFLAQIAGPDALLFVWDDSGLRLQTTGSEALSVRVDFEDSSITYRRQHGGGRGQMIAKAVGLRAGVNPQVFDATAGLGGDAFVLASLGCDLTLVERVPEVFALLEDGLNRAAFTEDLELRRVIDRMHLKSGDADQYLSPDSTDVVYLDPMFPQRDKRALVKKEMQVFHRLVGLDVDSDKLLGLSLRAARFRVVVKRPRHAPFLADKKPDHIQEGKRNRFDIYTRQKLPDRLNS